MKRFVFIILLISNWIVYCAPIKVGVLQFAPPFSAKSDASNHYYGFVIELMNTICRRLHESCEYVAIPSNGELYGLDNHVFDITFTPSPMTASLPDKYIYSLPYLPSYGQFLTLKSSPINSNDDITFKKIGYYRIDFRQSPILNAYNTTNKFIEYDDPGELINALMAKNIDVMIINRQAAKYIAGTLLSEGTSKIKLIGDKIYIGSGYAIIALRSNSALIDKINSILLDMEKDGTYLQIYNEYFGYNVTYPIHP